MEVIALKLAQELTPRYPDAQIFFDLQGVSAQTVTPAQAMAHVIRAFHPDTRIPDSETEIAALYRSALHGNRALLLKETRRAIELHEQHLAIAREIGDRRGEGNACWNLGLALEKTGETSRAAEVMQVFVDYEREIGHPDAERDAAYVEALRARSQPGDSRPQTTVVP